MGLHLPSVGGLICLAVGFGLIAGLMVLIVMLVSRAHGSVPSAFPVQPLGPGRFKVTGVHKDTRQDMTWYCEADSAENAKVKAELEGIIVTRIERG
jgi:hypothetical protein